MTAGAEHDQPARYTDIIVLGCAAVAVVVVWWRRAARLVLGLASLGWIILRWFLLRGTSGEAGFAVRRDLWVGLALAASWFAVWGLYAMAATSIGRAIKGLPASTAPSATRVDAGRFAR